MEEQNYALPLALDRIVMKQMLAKCPDREAIHQHLYLLMVTHFDETRFDENYGCALWEHDFSILSQIKWKDLIRESLEAAIARFERRLTQIKVRVEIEELEMMSKYNSYIRKRIGVEVKAVIRRTNEPFIFFERIFISPMSID
ncbi:GPW/gp25 family protein [Dyadobacter sp. 3J3]|uniref:GPW/gp25 family protein n=1 Tax=Dyadobacter sp. 3J3 TaxID=2606600 RepID=UPI0013597D84|nr:GPW/gp25 family protein [Dyadobacter sp. 3J3]